MIDDKLNFKSHVDYACEKKICVIVGVIPICITLAEGIECYLRKDTRIVRKTVKIGLTVKQNCSISVISADS